jgi:hypothetical protein
MDIFRREFLVKFAFGTAFAAAGLGLSRSKAKEAPRHLWRVHERLSIPDDWWVGGFHVNYHRRAREPKHWVDMITIIGRGGGASAGFVRRLVLAISESAEEANEGIAYLNSGIRDRWLIHGHPRSSGTPIENLRLYFTDVPSYLGTPLQDPRSRTKTLLSGVRLSIRRS